MAELSVLSIVEALLQLSMITIVGLYFIFSNTLMHVFSQSDEGATTMIEINKRILNPLFLTCFGVSGIAGVYFFYFDTGFQSAAGLVFFIGTTLVTMFFNVPLNDKLKQASRDTVPALWQTYLARWGAWNHVRTVCALLSGFLISL